jgi:hypothetical protein
MLEGVDTDTVGAHGKQALGVLAEILNEISGMVDASYLRE